MKYGFIRDEEFEMFDNLIPTIKKEFGYVRVIEVGVFGGETARGIAKRCKEIDCPVYIAGVDVNPGTFEFPTPDYAYYHGDSLEMWRNVTGTFNMCFIDGCHCVNHCTADFLNFSPLVEIGGYTLFHDTALPDGKDVQDEHQQDHSYYGKPPSVLGVREGLKKLGLLQGHRADWAFVREIPSVDGTCGMMLYRKVAEL